MRAIRTILTVVAASSLMVLAAPATAGAGVFQYDVENLGPSAQVYIGRLDSAKKTTIRLTRLGVLQHRVDNLSGSTGAWFNHETQPGDVIAVHQYASGDPNLPEPPITPPTDVFTVPQLTAAASDGSPVISGAASDGWEASVYLHHPCPHGSEETLLGARTPGAYSATFPFSALAGSTYSVELNGPSGDEVAIEGRIPGDGRCLHVDAETGMNPTATPYSVRVTNLDSSIGSVRVLLRRGVTVIAEDNDDELELTPGNRPISEDVIEVYRPQDAPTPAYFFVLSKFSGVIDFAGDLVHLRIFDGGLQGAWACRKHSCAPKAERWVDGFHGWGMMNFAEPQGPGRPYDLLETDMYGATFGSADEHVWIDFDLTPGDLVPPIGRLRIGRRLSARKLSRWLSFKLISNEAGNASAKLTARKLPKARSAATRSSVNLASDGRTLVAGSNSLTLTPSKKGKAVFKRLKRKASFKAVLTVTLRDRAGNSSTVTKQVSVTG